MAGLDISTVWDTFVELHFAVQVLTLSEGENVLVELKHSAWSECKSVRLKGVMNTTTLVKVNLAQH